MTSLKCSCSAGKSPRHALFGDDPVQVLQQWQLMILGPGGLGNLNPTGSVVYKPYILYICIYIYIYIYMYIYIYIHVHIIYTYMIYPCMCVWFHVQIFTHMCVCFCLRGCRQLQSTFTTGFSGPPAKSRAPQRARKPPPQSQWHQGQYTNLNEGWLSHWGKPPKWHFHDYLMTIDNISL